MIPPELVCSVTERRPFQRVVCFTHFQANWAQERIAFMIPPELVCSVTERRPLQRVVCFTHFQANWAQERITFILPPAIDKTKRRREGLVPSVDWLSIPHDF